MAALTLVVVAGCSGGATGSTDDSARGPEVLSHSAAGLSVAASTQVTRSIGVTNWEMSKTDSLLEVQGFDRDARLITDMTFDISPTVGMTVADRIHQSAMLVDARGTTIKDDFSSEAHAQFDAITLDSTALRAQGLAGAQSKTPEATGLVGQPCSVCYGVALECGTTTLTATGLYTCSGKSLCGVCFGWGW